MRLESFVVEQHCFAVAGWCQQRHRDLRESEWEKYCSTYREADSFSEPTWPARQAEIFFVLASRRSLRVHGDDQDELRIDPLMGDVRPFVTITEFEVEGGLWE